MLSGILVAILVVGGLHSIAYLMVRLTDISKD